MRTTEGRIQFLLTVLTLAAAETALVASLVLPYDSTRLDWLLTTLVLAPIAALCALCLIMLAVRIPADIAAGLVALTKWATSVLTKNRA